MATQYKILEFSPKEGKFIICYYTNTMDDGYTANIPLPFNDYRTGYLHGAELHRYIMEWGPQETRELQHLADTLSTVHIDALVYNRFEGMTSRQIKNIKDQELYIDYENRVSGFLDEAVQEKKYDGFDSLSTWKDADNEQWRKEAATALAWGEQVWSQFYKVWNDYQNNGTPMPSWDELVQQFPKLIW